ncbi:MAG: methyltransferase [Flammeovirgaceae bacterium]
MLKDRLKAFFTAHWSYLAVNAACKLSLFDFLEDGAKSIADIGQKKKLNKAALAVLLQALTEMQFLTEKEGLYQLTEQARLLTEKHPESLKYACMNWAEEHLDAWQALDYTIKTGKSSFENLHNQTFFDYLKHHPKKLHHYHLAMAEYARDDYKKLPYLIDFSQHSSIMDVGGGYGTVLHLIQKEFTETNFILFDLPDVVQNCPYPALSKIGGNFLEHIPKVANAIILSRVLHDWESEKVLLILSQCYQALPSQGTIYIIENCKDLIDIDLSLLSLNMQLMCESHERSKAEYCALCNQVGFQYQNAIPLNQLQTILIFKKL